MNDQYAQRIERRARRVALLFVFLFCSLLLIVSSTSETRSERARLLSQRPPGPSVATEPTSTYAAVSFELLGEAESTEGDWKATIIPAEVEELDGKRVFLEGYMMPLTFQGDKVESFLLGKDRTTCCFGVSPSLKDWVFVRMERPVSSVLDSPIEVRGVFFASPDIEGGEVLSLYRMSCESVKRKVE